MWKLNFSELTSKLQPMAQKYKYVLLIFLVGIIMLCLGSPRDAPKQDDNNTNIENTTSTFDLSSFEDSLEKQLSSINGAGEVSLLLSIEGTEETVYASNIRESTSSDSNNIYEKDLSVLSDSSYGEEPVKVKSISPTFRGAVVLCEGAADVSVKYSITEAVSAACGLSMDKISVLQMDTTQEDK
ncbi:MAG TPA: hypothetical protein H9746_02880 [Candidatus Butyricicoccus avistercoris]|uniref:Stage III sporulation protein AG n=1 Tax=Candidatus Butyricicoccus avistercoris TaxID=2838518 RepID=A0A9D1PI01_9FIRM|nr:hypothetical protein [Candidatus Butyricicoccus avistercoris]